MYLGGHTEICTQTYRHLQESDFRKHTGLRPACAWFESASTYRMEGNFGRRKFGESTHPQTKNYTAKLEHNF